MNTIVLKVLDDDYYPYVKAVPIEPLPKGTPEWHVDTTWRQGGVLWVCSNGEVQLQHRLGCYTYPSRAAMEAALDR